MSVAARSETTKSVRDCECATSHSVWRVRGDSTALLEHSKGTSGRTDVGEQNTLLLLELVNALAPAKRLIVNADVLHKCESHTHIGSYTPE